MVLQSESKVKEENVVAQQLRSQLDAVKEDLRQAGLHVNATHRVGAHANLQLHLPLAHLQAPGTAKTDVRVNYIICMLVLWESHAESAYSCSVCLRHVVLVTTCKIQVIKHASISQQHIEHRDLAERGADRPGCSSSAARLPS